MTPIVSDTNDKAASFNYRRAQSSFELKSHWEIKSVSGGATPMKKGQRSRVMLLFPIFGGFIPWPISCGGRVIAQFRDRMIILVDSHHK